MTDQEAARAWWLTHEGEYPQSWVHGNTTAISEMLAAYGAHARRLALEEAAKRICACCVVDGSPTDLMNHPDPSIDGGPRFVHEEEDAEIDCAAAGIWELIKPAATPSGTADANASSAGVRRQ